MCQLACHMFDSWARMPSSTCAAAATAGQWHRREHRPCGVYASMPLFFQLAGRSKVRRALHGPVRRPLDLLGGGLIDLHGAVVARNGAGPVRIVGHPRVVHRRVGCRRGGAHWRVDRRRVARDRREPQGFRRAGQPGRDGDPLRAGADRRVAGPTGRLPTGRGAGDDERAGGGDVTVRWGVHRRQPDGSPVRDRLPARVPTTYTVPPAPGRNRSVPTSAVRTALTRPAAKRLSTTWSPRRTWKARPLVPSAMSRCGGASAWASSRTRPSRFSRTTARPIAPASPSRYGSSDVTWPGVRMAETRTRERCRRWPPRSRTSVAAGVPAGERGRPPAPQPGLW